MKSYTDISQSKKLAEILPLESADMIWVLANPDLPMIKAIAYEDSDKNNKYYEILPAWSLAALLSSLPFPVLYMEMVAGMIFWCCECHFIETDEMFKIEHYDNPIDACVTMIERLHELKML